LLEPLATKTGKPLLAAWMGAGSVRDGEDILNKARIPTFAYPDTATRVFDYMWEYTDTLRQLYETPLPTDGDGGGEIDRAKADALIAAARASGRTILTEYESKQLMLAYGIPTVPTDIAVTEDDAVAQAARFGYPIVLKLHSETITHKTDVGGVQLNLRDEAAVRAAFRKIREAVRERAGEGHFLGVTVQPMVKLDGYEVILGCSLDVQLGPVLLFGSGGQLVEVFKDRALALPPLNTTLARRMMEQTKIYTALQGVRGRAPADLDALSRLVVRFSQLVVEQRWIKEIDINPLLIGEGDSMIALDARVVLHEPATAAAQLPTLAIRPYPTRYAEPHALHDGTPLTIRPIRPEDEPAMRQFHETLSEQSVYLRYFHYIPLSERIAHERLLRICFNDYDRELALVAECERNDRLTEILGVGRLIKMRGGREAEFAILISDQYQHQGLGRELLSRLVRFGRDEGLTRIYAEILPENAGMIKVSEQVGFTLKRGRDVVLAELVL
jgi:acetyltransferase